VTVGAKDTLTVQLAPAVRLFGQSLVTANSPLAEMPEKFSGLPPKLVIVTGWELLEVPISWLAKVKVAGEKPIAEGRGVGSRAEAVVERIDFSLIMSICPFSTFHFSVEFCRSLLWQKRGSTILQRRKAWPFDLLRMLPAFEGTCKPEGGFPSCQSQKN
jgi:hypothetical protein